MERCIIRTLSYFDIFDYPLTFFEIKKYLCCKIELTDIELEDLICSISVIQSYGGYYYFLGRREIVERRIEKGFISLEKYAIAKVVAKTLSYIPTIEYIGVSGSLSMNNASSSDDIDLFFITKKNTVWISRLAVNAFLFLIGRKRDREGKNLKNRICPNMFVSFEAMGFEKKRRTLYTAHEIVQLKSLVDKKNIYEVFLAENRWVKAFLPNIIIPNTKKLDRKAPPFIKSIEKIFYLIQKWYMKKRITKETVDIKRAYFHPIDRQKIILKMFEFKFKQYERLLNENLWIDTEDASYYMQEKKIRILN